MQLQTHEIQPHFNFTPYFVHNGANSNVRMVNRASFEKLVLAKLTFLNKCKSVAEVPSAKLKCKLDGK